MSIAGLGADRLVIPTSVAAPDPGWFTSADVVVIGSGVAGLSLALNIRRLGHRVLVVTKSWVEEGATRWAQGGIAAALADGDSPADHERDTLVAGAGLCDPAAVHELCTLGPAAVRNLIAAGARFDHDTSGGIALTREGGHLRDRIAHAGGDATGAEIFRALVAAIADDPGIELVQHALALDLLTDAHGGVQGLTLHVIGEGQHDGVGAVLAPAVVIATGGLGQVFAQTTNPAVATGDGMALALRAGAEVADLEFVQFHPTVMYLGPDSTGQQPLVSEAVRGEGAFLVDDDGVRFMQGLHPAGRPRPARRRGQGDHPADARAGSGAHVARRPRPRRPLGDAVPDDPGVLPPARDRSGARPDPGRPGAALRVRGRAHRPPRAHHDPRALRRRRGGLHRGARCQPPGVELPARGTGVPRADRLGARRGAAAPWGPRRPLRASGPWSPTTTAGRCRSS